MRAMATGARWLLTAPLGLLAACGGGGGGVSSTPTPASTAATTPVAPVVNYDDAEYARSNAAVDAGALTAYKAGASGGGITVAIVDTGLATVGGEFTGRVSSASRAFGGNTSFADTDGHGTAIAAIAAAGRNGADIEGIAWGATLLALRTDTAGTCGTTDGCNFTDANLTSAVDYARTSGAKVINLSLGGSAGNGQFTAAIARATAAGIIVVVAAGNDGGANPDAFAQVAAAQAAGGLVIIAGSHDAAGAISSFSGRAGGFGQYYLTALGEKVRSFNQNGDSILASGTSFSTPAIAGAIALIEQAFPNLTPTQVVDLLYRSATDAGAAGVDAIYGRGLLNIARAFQPVGTASLAGGTTIVAATDATTLSPAMGDAAIGPAATGSAIILDGYGRAFEMAAAGTVRRMAADRPLGEGLRADLATRTTDLGAISVTTTLARRFADAPWRGLALAGAGFFRDADRPRSEAMVSRFGPGFASGVAVGESAATLAARFGDEAPAGSFLAARTPAADAGLIRRPGFALATRRSLGRLSLLAEAERGEVGPSYRDAARPPGYTEMRVGAVGRFGALRLGGTVGTLVEAGTLLGARLAPALGGAGGGTTRLIDLDARLDLGDGWALAGAVRRGWTRGKAGGALASARLRSEAAALDLSRERAASRLALRVARPMRVTGGGLALVVPTAYDYASGAIGYSARFVGLAPRGRETDVEANAGLRLGGGWLESNLFWRRQPGNLAVAPDDLGGGLRYALDF